MFTIVVKLREGVCKRWMRWEEGGQHRVLDVERLGARKNLSAAKEGLAARAFVLPLYALLTL